MLMDYQISFHFFEIFPQLSNHSGSVAQEVVTVTVTLAVPPTDQADCADSPLLPALAGSESSSQVA